MNSKKIMGLQSGFEPQDQDLTNVIYYIFPALLKFVLYYKLSAKMSHRTLIYRLEYDWINNVFSILFAENILIPEEVEEKEKKREY